MTCGFGCKGIVKEGLSEVSGVGETITETNTVTRMNLDIQEK